MPRMAHSGTTLLSSGPQSRADATASVPGRPPQAAQPSSLPGAASHGGPRQSLRRVPPHVSSFSCSARTAGAHARVQTRLLSPKATLSAPSTPRLAGHGPRFTPPTANLPSVHTSRRERCHVEASAVSRPWGPPYTRLAECKGRHLGWTPAPSPALHLEPEPCPRAGARAGCLWAGRPLAGPLGSQSPAGTRFGAPRTSELMRVECETSFGRCRGQPTPTHRPFAPCYGPSTPGGGHLLDRRPGLSSMAPPGPPHSPPGPSTGHPDLLSGLRPE